MPAVSLSLWVTTVGQISATSQLVEEERPASNALARTAPGEYFPGAHHSHQRAGAPGFPLGDIRPVQLENLEQSGEHGFVKPAIRNRDQRLWQSDDASRSEAYVLSYQQVGGGSLAR